MMSLRSVLLHSIFLCGILGKGWSSSDEPLDIWCLEDHVKIQRNIVRGMKNTSLCTAKTIGHYPFTFGDQNRTPAAPEDLSSKVKVFQTSDDEPTKQIAVYVSWLYRKDYFEYVDSYHIELTFLKPFGSGKQYLVEWNKGLKSIVGASPAIFLRFNFIYTGSQGNYHVKPRKEYYFRIMALPMYGENETAQDVWTIVKIPDCENKTVKKTDYCRNRPCHDGRIRVAGKCTRLGISQTKKANVSATKVPKNDPITEKSLKEDKSTNALVHILLATVGGILIVLLLSGLLVGFYRKRSGNGGNATAQSRTRVLLVCTSDNGFLDAINQFISMLLEFPNVDVVCNLRQKTEIGMKGIQDWTKIEVCHSDVICFAVANPYEVVKHEEHEENENSRLDNVEKHQVSIVMRATETIVVNKTSENPAKKFALLDLCECVKKDVSPYFRLFKFPGDVKKFIKFSLGDNKASGMPSFQNKRKIFKNLLSNAQLGYSHSLRSFGDEEKITQSGKEDHTYSAITDFPNNLDDPTEKLAADSDEHETEINLSLNILPSGPSSCESNRSETYTTTDFNVENEARMQKLIQAGARPKQPIC